MNILVKIVLLSEYLRFRLVMLIITILSRSAQYLVDNHINTDFVNTSRYEKYRGKLDKVMDEFRKEMDESEKS